MSVKIEPRIPRGMRDILPEQMVRRQYVIDVIRSTFEEFGFEPLHTPALELEETLMGKYGPDAERLIYSTTYGGGDEKLSLRYDLSVPLCRVMAMYPDLPKPFKRYHIAPVWRADRPQKGRYREFYQCDADTVGSSSMLGDAETVAVIYTILYRLGFRKFTVHISSRKLLIGIGQYAGVANELLLGMYQAIDKLAKIGVRGVRHELLSVGLPDAVFETLRRVARLYLQGKLKLEDVAARLQKEQLPAEKGQAPQPFPLEIAAAVEADLLAILAKEKPGSVEPERLQEAAGVLASGLTPALRKFYAPTTALIPDQVADQLMALLEIQGKSQDVVRLLKERLIDFPIAQEGLNELEEMLHYLELLEVPETNFAIDVAMVRGLEYYTGPIYETIIEEAHIGSVTGGGRYDKLISMFTDRSLPSTGTTLGIERIIVAMEDLNMFPPAIGKTATQVMVTVFDRTMIDESVKAAAMLRQANLRTQVYFDPDPLREQIGYAVKKEIPILVIIGTDEAAQGKLTVRNLRSKNQETVSREVAADLIRGWLEQL